MKLSRTTSNFHKYTIKTTQQYQQQIMQQYTIGNTGYITAKCFQNIWQSAFQNVPIVTNGYMLDTINSCTHRTISEFVTFKNLQEVTKYIRLEGHIAELTSYLYNQWEWLTMATPLIKPALPHPMILTAENIATLMLTTLEIYEGNSLMTQHYTTPTRSHDAKWYHMM